MKQTKKTRVLVGLGLCACLCGALSGCGTTPASAPQETAGSQESAKAQAIGSILLSVNPEIEISYDDQGEVVELEGVNDDGIKVVNNYSDYEGRQASEVVGELVTEIDEDGYFANGIGGHEKNIVLKLTEGSAYPDEAFLDDIAQQARSSVEKRGVTSKAYAINDDDLDKNGLIGIEAAQELVLGQLGIDPATATFHDHEYELDDGVYELEFTANGIEYDYEVDARTGKILEADFERNDDWDDRDDWTPSAGTATPDDDRDDDADDRDDWDDDRDDIDDRDDDWDDDRDDDWDDDRDDDRDDDDDDDRDDDADDRDDWDDDDDDDWDDDGWDD